MIRAKLAGTELPESVAKPATEEVDLVAALQASVEALKRGKAAAEAAAQAERAEKPKARRTKARVEA